MVTERNMPLITHGPMATGQLAPMMNPGNMYNDGYYQQQPMMNYQRGGSQNFWNFGGGLRRQEMNGNERY